MDLKCMSVFWENSISGSNIYINSFKDMKTLLPLFALFLVFSTIYENIRLLLLPCQNICDFLVIGNEFSIANLVKCTFVSCVAIKINVEVALSHCLSLKLLRIGGYKCHKKVSI